jgi:hypothetical protein
MLLQNPDSLSLKHKTGNKDEHMNQQTFKKYVTSKAWGEFNPFNQSEYILEAARAKARALGEGVVDIGIATKAMKHFESSIEGACFGLSLLFLSAYSENRDNEKYSKSGDAVVRANHIGIRRRLSTSDESKLQEFGEKANKLQTMQGLKKKALDERFGLTDKLMEDLEKLRDEEFQRLSAKIDDIVAQIESITKTG